MLLPRISFACSNILINKPNYVIEARTLDFPIELLDINNETYRWYRKVPFYRHAIKQLLTNAFSYSKGYIGEEKISQVITQTKTIPNNRLVSWQTKYGYLGRKGFIGNSLLDGMNTEGLSISALFLPGTKYPKYDKNDARNALSIYDLSDYLLSMASSTDEAVKLVQNIQIVESSLKAISGIFVKDIPIHISIRDQYGDSAVIQFIDHKVVIHHLGSVLTNAPSYPDLINYTSAYNNLLGTQQSNASFIKQSKNYHLISQQILKPVKQLSTAQALVLPTDSSSHSRFVKAQYLLSHLPRAKTTREAINQADLIINKLVVPKHISNATLWVTFKDLKNKKIYYQDLHNYGKRMHTPEFMANGHESFDLNKMDFQKPKFKTLKLKQPEEVKVIYSVYDIPGIKSYFITDAIALNN
ncbi:linear amide C-N hydrolase [Thiotrichales bacterium 19S11-10]|nr:linear amide C-N hydrolase [Thiotrichales bacterium 19S11-10]